MEVRPTAASRRGLITLVTGCMFSGKTTRLLNHLSSQPAGTAAAVRHINDDRYRRDAIVSHDGRTCPAQTIRAAAELRRWACVSELRLLVIDEVHFLDAQLVDVVDKLAQHGLNVMMAGLDLDSWGQPFRDIERLAQRATRHIKHQAVCARCGCAADRTQRLTPIVRACMVGGAESYEPRCKGCWTPPAESPPSQTLDRA